MTFDLKTGLLTALILLASAGAETARAGSGVPDEVLVAGGPAPVVSATYPADGAAISGGLLILKVTFDRPMNPDEWDYGPLAGVEFPKCLGQPRLLNDHRTFVLLCSVNAHASYAVQINAPTGFRSQAGRAAKPTVVKFSTGDVGPNALHDALKEAGLTDEDDPIMAGQDPGKGVSHSPPPETP
jgi:hypothetical protein